MRHIARMKVFLPIQNSVYLNILLLFVLSILFQFFLFQRCFSNTILNECLPSAVDSFDYANRSNLFLKSGFSDAFGDAFRMPGYPLIISLFTVLFGNDVFISLRAFQVVLTAISIPLIYLSLNHSFQKFTSFGISIFFLFLPSWYFSPLLLAESLSYFLGVILIIRSIKIIRLEILEGKDILFLAVIIALATYLKPNHVLWIVPMLVLVFLTSKTKFLSTFTLLAIVGICLSPWLVFANHENPTKFTFTSASGGNIYIGTGMQLSYDDGPLAKAAVFWKVDPKSNSLDVISDASHQDIRVLDEVYSKKALYIWKERPLRQIGFGITKVAIAFSIYTNSITQFFLGVLFLISIVFTSYILISKMFIPKSKTICVLYCSIIWILASQAFVFQADRRFIFPLLIPSWLLIAELLNTKIRNIKSF